MTAALEGLSGQQHAPATLYPRERPATHSTGSWVGPRGGPDNCGKSRPTGIRSLYRPVRSQSLYKLSKPCPYYMKSLKDAFFLCNHFSEQLKNSSFWVTPYFPNTNRRCDFVPDVVEATFRAHNQITTTRYRLQYSAASVKECQARLCAVSYVGCRWSLISVVYFR